MYFILALLDVLRHDYFDISVFAIFMYIVKMKTGKSAKKLKLQSNKTNWHDKRNYEL